MSVLLDMKNICKNFTGVKANKDCNLQIEKGEVHALLGENGAGKSTLMNVLYGLYAPSSGDVIWKGQKVEIKSPKAAIELGIGMVHQHFMLIPALSVIENVVLGMHSGKKAYLDLKNAAEKFEKLSEKYNMHIDPWAEVGQLSVGQQQRLEILKALYRGADLLILDEPTAVLVPQEVDELFQIIRKLTSEGHTVIFISHKLNEVMSICDRVTVLRLGESITTIETKDTDKEELARLMVGREVSLMMDKISPKLGNVVLEVKNLECINNKGIKALKGLNLKLQAGEILGIAGVDGNGQSELVEAIVGLRKVTNGQVIINSHDVTNKSPREILDEKVGHIPEDRHKRGVALPMNLTENIMLMSYYKEPYSKGIRLHWNKIYENAEKIIEQFQIKTPSKDELMKNLSGGNQQKIVLGREISKDPNLLIAMHPVRGLDIGATEYVHERLVEQRDQGRAVLLISGELEELITLSDRIAVMYEGEIMGIVDAKDVNIQELGLMMTGAKKNAV
ncbi:MAG: transporter ATP-binding protein [Clostridiales bacterium]|nr:transporter ATP-binding protein [Clostridiales bacterium]